MSNPNILDVARQKLCDAISSFQVPPCDPLTISPWIAMSLMQKAVRRGDEPLALRATSTLLHVSPERLWRRGACIAFEDIGLADIETVSLVTAALSGKRFRAQLGGEWKVASFVVSRMARARKCRCADDLLLAAELHPAYADARRDLADATVSDLMGVVMGPAPLPVRALGFWYGVGTGRRPSPHLQPRRGAPTQAFDALGETDIPQTIVEISREGFRKTSEVLCPFLALLWPERQRETATTADDPLPPEVMIGEVPSWAYDLYSREGRHALQTFLQGDSATARWVCAHIPPRQRIHFLGTIVFRVEGGLCRQRLHWPTANELQRLVDFECHGPHCPDATEILHLMRSDLPQLNEVRRHVLTRGG